ncbi:hypothetical protein [Treponema sp. R6D11]
MMLNYIKADLYRIFSKKSLYIVFASFLALFLIAIYVQSGSMTNGRVSTLEDYIFMFLNIILGIYLFNTIYNDDLNARSLPSLIGFGIKRSVIIISKFIIAIIISAVLYFLVSLCFYFVISLMGFAVNIVGLAQIVLASLFKLLALFSVASVVVYGTQKASVSIVAFVLLITGFVSQMLLLILNQMGFDKLYNYSIGPITTSLVNNPSVNAAVPYLIYVIFFIALSIFAFKKKDLEF